MADGLKQAMAGFTIPAPGAWSEPTTEEDERRAKLRELVWERVPRHLVKQPCHPQYRKLIDRWEWGVSWVLLGQTGAGKSTACVHLVRHLLRIGVANGGDDFLRAKSIFWTRADAITKAGGADTDEAAKLLHRAEYSRLMILDDLAAPSKTLLGVIQARYDHQRPIIATCGALNAKQFIETVGGEAVSRWILECGGIRHGIILGGEPKR